MGDIDIDLRPKAYAYDEVEHVTFLAFIDCRIDSSPSVLAATATPHPTTAVSSVTVAPSVLGLRMLY